MDRHPVRSAPYPHHSWIALWIAIEHPSVFGIHQCRHVSHHVMLTVAGSADIRWSTCDTETSFHANAGTLTFFPCDFESHALSITSGERFLA